MLIVQESEGMRVDSLSCFPRSLNMRIFERGLQTVLHCVDGQKPFVQSATFVDPGHLSFGVCGMMAEVRWFLIEWSGRGLLVMSRAK